MVIFEPDILKSTAVLRASEPRDVSIVEFSIAALVTALSIVISPERAEPSIANEPSLTVSVPPTTEVVIMSSFEDKVLSPLSVEPSIVIFSTSL